MPLKLPVLSVAVVVNTGINTEVGKIAENVTTTKESPSPLTIRMEKFSKQISILIIIIALIIAVVLFKQNKEPVSDFNQEFLKNVDNFSESWRKEVEKMMQRKGNSNN